MELRTGSDLRRAREQLGMTQEELAYILGIGRRTLIRMEERTHPVRPLTALAIQSLLDTHLRENHEGTESQP